MHDYLDEAVEAERLGWDGYFATEHHFDGWTLVPQPNIFLAALAMRTSRMRLGQGVQVLPVHNPVWLAEQYGMLDLLSGGRLEVGLGRGNFEFEWDRYAEDHDDAPRLFDENLRAAAQGAHRDRLLPRRARLRRSARPSTVYPRPLQDPLPDLDRSRHTRVGRARRPHGSEPRGPRDPGRRASASSATSRARPRTATRCRARTSWSSVRSSARRPTGRPSSSRQRNRTTMVETLAARGVRDDTPLGARWSAGSSTASPARR